jgi:tRNA dimethylallyltransferase
VVVLLGPTASGKTALLERTFDGSFEVVVADSMQVYRGLDIGTAKPSASTLRSIPHHLIDVLEPTQQYTCGDFVRAADEAIRGIVTRGRVAVVCGGTAYYIRSFVFGMPDSPRADPAVREKLEADARHQGLEALYRELCLRDPLAASSIHPNDRYRILRALEIIRLTGRPRSAFAVPSEPRSTWSFTLVGLRVSREALAGRIADRVRGMFDQGLVAEVKGLVKRGYGMGDPALRAIGYREFLEMRRGCRSFGDVRERIGANTLRFARRQMTFFRAIPGVQWLDPEDIEGVRGLIAAARGNASRPEVRP